MENIIFLKVDEEICMACFTILDHPVHLMAHVQFEDGYENIFYNDVETGNWIEQDLGFTNLAEETGKRLAPYFKHIFDEYKALTWMYLESKEYSFGYHKYLSGDYEVYEIYHANRRHMFTAVKSSAGLWQIILFSGDTTWSHPKSYYEEIPYMLDLCAL